MSPKVQAPLLPTNKHQDLVDRLPILLLSLRARPNNDGGLSPHQWILPADFPSQDAQEIEGTGITRSCRKPGRVMSNLSLQANRRDKSAGSET